MIVQESNINNLKEIRKSFIECQEQRSRNEAEKRVNLGKIFYNIFAYLEIFIQRPAYNHVMYIELHLILHSWNCTQLTQYRVLRNRLFDKRLFSRNGVLGVCNRRVNLSLANHVDYVPCLSIFVFYFFF